MIVASADLTEFTESLIPTNSLPARRNSQVSRFSNQVSNLRSHLWDQLPLTGLQPAKSAQLSHLLDSYSSGSERIERWRGEVDTLLTAICTSCVYGMGFDSDSLREAMQAEADKLMQPIARSSIMAPEVVNAKLAEMQIAVVHDALLDASSTSLDAFLTHMLGSFAVLYRSQTIGSIEWTNDSTCRFEYPRLEVSEDGFEEEYGYDGFIEEVTETEKFKCVDLSIEHFIHRAQIDYQNRLPASAPLPAEHVWRAIPDFLTKYSSIVKGDIFRQRETECESWESTVVSTQIRADSILNHADPAIVLFDQLVLTGWVDGPESTTESVSLAAPQEAFDTSSARASRRTEEVQRRNGQIFDAKESLSGASGLLFFPVISSAICSFFSPRAMLIPVLFAVFAAVSWAIASLRMNQIQSRAWDSRASILSIAAGVCYAWSAVVIPHALVNLSIMSGIVGTASFTAGVYFWFSQARTSRR